MSDTPDEHRKRWEGRLARAGFPGFRVVSWSSKEHFYEILLARETEGTKETLTYTLEDL